MKKIIVILTLALIGMTAVYSQDMQTPQVAVGKADKDYATHRLFIYGSAGYSNNIYDRINKTFIYDHYSYSAAFEMRYAFFFAPQWGVSLGAGASRFNAKGTLNIEGVLPNYNDPAFDPSGQHYYDLYYKTNDLVEEQIIYALEVPLQFHFEKRLGSSGIFASLGAKGYFPLSAQSEFPQGKGTITTKGYEAYTNTWYTDPPHFGEWNVGGTPPKVKLNPYSVDAIADFGTIIRLSRICDLYIGVYGSYGLMDILPKAADKKNFISSEQNNSFTVNSLLASNYLGEYNKYVKDNDLGWKTADEKWNQWQIGLKIGLHINFSGKKYEKEKSNSEITPTFVRDTVHVVNIYNMAPIVQAEDSDFTATEREDIDKLTNLLSNGKILFDLDSDVPKIDNKNFIAASAEIFNMEPGFRLIIEGYTCELGTEEHNRNLASRRAKAIRKIFIEEGVDPTRIQTAAYTVHDPESHLNITEESLKAHRVVIFRIVKGDN